MGSLNDALFRPLPAAPWSQLIADGPARYSPPNLAETYRSPQWQHPISHRQAIAVMDIDGRALDHLGAPASGVGPCFCPTTWVAIEVHAVMHFGWPAYEFSSTTCADRHRLYTVRTGSGQARYSDGGSLSVWTFGAASRSYVLHAGLGYRETTTPWPPDTAVDYAALSGSPTVPCDPSDPAYTLVGTRSGDNSGQGIGGNTGTATHLVIAEGTCASTAEITLSDPCTWDDVTAAAGAILADTTFLQADPGVWSADFTDWSPYPEISVRYFLPAPAMLALRTGVEWQDKIPAICAVGRFRFPLRWPLEASARFVTRRLAPSLWWAEGSQADTPRIDSLLTSPRSFESVTLSEPITHPLRDQWGTFAREDLRWSEVLSARAYRPFAEDVNGVVGPMDRFILAASHPPVGSATPVEATRLRFRAAGIPDDWTIRVEIETTIEGLAPAAETITLPISAGLSDELLVTAPDLDVSEGWISLGTWWLHDAEGVRRGGEHGVGLGVECIFWQRVRTTLLGWAPLDLPSDAGTWGPVARERDCTERYARRAIRTEVRIASAASSSAWPCVIDANVEAWFEDEQAWDLDAATIDPVEVVDAGASLPGGVTWEPTRHLDVAAPMPPARVVPADATATEWSLNHGPYSLAIRSVGLNSPDPLGEVLATEEFSGRYESGFGPSSFTPWAARACPVDGAAVFAEAVRLRRLPDAP